VRGIVGRDILRELLGAIGKNQVAPALEIFAKLLDQGKDVNQILLEIEEYLRSLLLISSGAGLSTDLCDRYGHFFPAISTLFCTGENFGEPRRFA
jgi:DNA polymerase III gamma/tau subunit